jgi:hypothetical protein
VAGQGHERRLRGMSMKSPVYLRLRKDCGIARTDVEGQLQTLAPQQAKRWGGPSLSRGPAAVHIVLIGNRTRISCHSSNEAKLLDSGTSRRAEAP